MILDGISPYSSWYVAWETILNFLKENIQVDIHGKWLNLDSLHRLLIKKNYKFLNRNVNGWFLKNLDTLSFFLKLSPTVHHGSVLSNKTWNVSVFCPIHITKLRILNREKKNVCTRKEENFTC